MLTKRSLLKKKDKKKDKKKRHKDKKNIVSIVGYTPEEWVLVDVDLAGKSE